MWNELRSIVRTLKLVEIPKNVKTTTKYKNYHETQHEIRQKEHNLT